MGKRLDILFFVFLLSWLGLFAIPAFILETTKNAVAKQQKKNLPSETYNLEDATPTESNS